LQKDLGRAERKYVSVLFADIVSSFEAIENKDIEWIETFLSDAVQGMSAAVHRYGGTVSGTRGDGILALFGAPLAREDHSSRACLAALAILEFAATERQRGRNLVVRIGINSGEVIVGVNAFDLSVQYDAVGETVHLAARMEQMARPGTAFLTADTLQSAEGLLRVRSLGWMSVRGLSKPVEVYELLGAIPNAVRVHSEPYRSLTPFINRESELWLLQNSASAARAGHGRIASVVGEAGSGKSRLVEKFVRSEPMACWHFASAGCLSYDSATDCAPFAQLLRHHLHLESEYDSERLRKALSTWIDSLGPGLSWLIAPLLMLFGADSVDQEWLLLAPAERRQQLIAAISTALLQEARIRPLCILVEDLHWSDVGTREVLDHLVDALPTAALLCIVTYRPGVNFAWQDRTCSTAIRLAPLETTAAKELLQHIMGNSSDLESTIRVILDRANGNPLFLEECVRSLVDEGVLQGEIGAFYPAKEIREIVLPPTITLVVSQRIDLLDPTAKRVLQASAAIGVQIPVVILAEIVQLSDQLLARALDRLCRAEFIDQTVFFPDPEYRFRHVILRDVAYEGLLREQRTLLHQKVLSAMELRLPERKWDLAERFAHHAIASGSAEKAIGYAQSAGRKSASRSACREAVKYYEEALNSARILPDLMNRSTLEIDLRLEMRYPLFQLGELPRVRQLMLEAESIASAADDRVRAAQVALFLSHISWLMGQHEASVSYGETSARLGQELKQQDLVQRANFFVGLAYMGLGQLAETARRMRETADYFRTRPAEVSRGLGALAGVALGYLIRALVDLGNREAAMDLVKEAKRVSEAEGTLPTIITSVSVGYLYQTNGEIELALRTLVDAYELSRSSRVRLMVPIVQTYLGAAYLTAGDPQTAAPLLREATEEASSIQLLYFQPVRMSHLARAEFALGRRESARELAKAALRLAQEQGEAHSEVQALLTLAEVYANDGQDSGVNNPIRVIRSAYKKATNLGLALAAADCELAMVRFYKSCGDEVRVRLYQSRISRRSRRDNTLLGPDNNAVFG
jgi:class 3 adenylate cyclase/tetratricopeptide (TPR) repeat protein